jgi:quercetin dioxygenase-like cupin family protein
MSSTLENEIAFATGEARETGAKPKAYKRSPSLDNSTWYKGILISQLAGKADTNGAFDFVVSKMRRGTEPPPHVHSREHEFFYVLDGSLNIYVEGKVLAVGAGECAFLPKGEPHAFLIQSAEIEVIVSMTPGGFLSAVNKMNAPAEKMELPSDDAVIYATADLTETMKIFEMYGLRFLSLKEIAQDMPQFPTSP